MANNTRHKVDLRGFRITTRFDDFHPDVDAAVIQLNDSDRGILITRLTTIQRDAIVNPPDGLLIFNTDSGKFEYFFGGSWDSSAKEDVETTLVFSPTLTWDMHTNPVAIVTITADTTITLANGVAGGAYRLAVIQGVGAPFTPTIVGATIRGNVTWETVEGGINIFSVDMVGSTPIATIL